MSVIILNYNGRSFLEPCLDSVLGSDYPNFEVIFVDNGSTDGSVELVRELYGADPRVEILVKSENVGVTRGLNAGIERGKGEYVVFLNNDTKVEPGWLGMLVEKLEGDRCVGAAQCKLLAYEDPRRIDSAGCVIDAHGCAVERGRVRFDLGEVDRGQYDRVEEIFSAGCPASIVRGYVLSEVGPFDPEFFAGYEDADLSWRIRLRGYKIVLVPQAVVYHRRGATSSRRVLGRDIAWHFSKNRIAMLIKNYSLRNLLRVMPFVLSLYSLVSLYLLRFGLEMFVVPLRAVLWNMRELRYLLRQRYVVQKRIRRVRDDEVSRMMSKRCILVQYYLQPFLSSVVGRR